MKEDNINIANSNKDYILQQIFDYFVGSSDYNGLPIYNLNNPTKSSVIPFLIKLITEESICIIADSHDVNPHIIRLGFLSKEDQIDYLSNYEGNGFFCMYPSLAYLKEHRDVSNLVLQPFKQLMALGFPQYKACYFDYDILHTYASDPRMNFIFNDYSGSIQSDADISDANSIHLKSFGIGRNKDSIIVVSYPRDLQEMSTSNQLLWVSHRIENDEDCKTLKDYNDNQLMGCWSFPNTVYRSILKEISNINELTKEAFDKTLFLKTYSKSDLKTFDMLTFPSLDVYNQFLLLLEKVVISNIDIKFFNSFVDIEDDKGKLKGSLVCLKEWVEMVRQDVADDIYTPLHKVRRERQPAAHKVETNEYSNEYLLKQHQLCSEVYVSLNLLRRLIQTHPKVISYTIRYPNTQYIDL